MAIDTLPAALITEIDTAPTMDRLRAILARECPVLWRLVDIAEASVDVRDDYLRAAEALGYGEDHEEVYEMQLAWRVMQRAEELKGSQQ